jgi:hypothetical protein
VGLSADNVLFNFYQATSLKISSIGVNGSILAPLADVTANNGNINGTIIAKSWNGTGELRNVPFEKTSPVPVPGTGLLLFSGLMGLASVQRKMKR